MKRQRRSLVNRLLSRWTAMRARRARLRVERLEPRAMLAVTITPPGVMGRIYVDQDSSGTFDAGEQVEGAAVQLFLDDGNGVFDGADTQVGADATTDVDGEYGFGELDATARYFVRQPAQTVDGHDLQESVSGLINPGSIDLNIDTFQGEQTVLANVGNPTATTVLATTEALGGERDLGVTLDSGDFLTLMIDQPTADGVALLDGSPAAEGAYRITWDGVDEDGAILAFNLGAVDLTQGGDNTGLLLLAGSESAGVSATVRIYEDNATNVSELTVPVPQTTGGEPTGTVFFPFANFSDPSAASPNSVDAIVLEVTGTGDVTGIQVAAFGALAPVAHDFVNEAEAEGVDLVIAKFAPSGDVNPGQTITYNINVQNNGEAVVGASIEDVIPPQLTNAQWTSVAQGGATGNSPSGTGNIDEVVDMPAGSSIVYVVTATVRSDASGSVANTATVTPPEGTVDANPSDNTSTQTNPIVRTIDLAITKTDLLEGVVPDQQFEYVIDVMNNGPSDAVGASIIDDLPDNLVNVTYTSEVISGVVTGNTANGTGDINDTVNMSVGAALRYHIQATVATDPGESVTNTATVQAAEGFVETNEENNSVTNVNPVVMGVDLFVTKDNGVTTVAPGEAVTYTIVVGNNGPDTATGAVFSDNFPVILTNVAYTSVAAGGATGNSPTGTGNIMETLTIPMGGTVTYTVTGTVAPDAHLTTSTLVNPATVAVPDGITDRDNSNNTDTDTDMLEPRSDLAIAKTTTATGVTPNGMITYQIVVSNTGPSTAADAAVADVFPDTLTNVSFTSVAAGGASGNVAIGVGDIDDLVTLPPNSSVTYTVTATATGDATGTIANTATVTAPTGVEDPDLDNNTSTVETDVVTTVDLMLTKSNTSSQVPAGGALQYTIVVTNPGGVGVTGARITDVFPASLTNVSFTSTATGGATGNTAIGNGNLDETVNLPAGSSITYEVTATVVASATGTITNTATVTPPTGLTDSNLNNNSDSEVDDVVAGVDLAIAKSNATTTVTPGGQIQYTIVVSNVGTTTATGATVVDNFPSSLTNVAFTSSVTGGATGNTASGSGNINDTVTMPAGSTITYLVTGTVAATATGTITNTATVSPPNGAADINPGDNTDSESDDVAGGLDLSIAKSNSTTTVTPGGQIQYTIVVSNVGGTAVTGATVTDTFPASLTNVTYTSTVTAGATGNTASGTGNINDTVNMPAGSTITYLVTATVANTATGTITNTAIVSPPSGTVDDNPDNNSDSESDTVGSGIDLSVAKSNSTTTVNPNGQIQYTIVVSNLGTVTATGATVTDTFPASLTNVTYTSTVTAGATGNTASGTGNINDTVNMPAGSTITYQVTATVASSATGTITNTATVSPPNGTVDDNPANNTDSESDTVVSGLDLAISKSNSTTTVTPGGQMQYTIVVSNPGTVNVTGATVTDTFPSSLTGVTFTSTVTGGATGNTATGTGNINDTVNMPAGSTITYMVTATVANTATGTITNTATVTAPTGTTEPNLDNNSDSESDTVGVGADLAITKTNNGAQVSPGSQLQYTITVSNPGTVAVTGATVVDTFPAALTNVTFTTTATGGATGNTAGSGNINQTVNLPVGSTIVYQVTGTVSNTATGTISNTATVATPSGVTDTNPNNNSATQANTVAATVDLSVTKTDNQTTVTPGQTLTYTIVVSNAGPGTATGATLVDNFPTTLTNVSFTSTAAGGATGNTASGTGNLNQTLTLPSGSSVTYTVTGTVSPTINTATLANTATVTAPSGVTDSNPNNNSATDTNTVEFTPGSVSGTVYHDANGDGVFTPGVDIGLSDVTLTLTGTALNGQAVSTTATTGADGAYSFGSVLPGAYTLRQTQPTFFVDGPDTPGAGSDPNTEIEPTANNDEFFIQLANGDDVLGTNFGEGELAFSKRMFLASST